MESILKKGKDRGFPIKSKMNCTVHVCEVPSFETVYLSCLLQHGYSADEIKGSSTPHVCDSVILREQPAPLQASSFQGRKDHSDPWAQPICPQSVNGRRSSDKKELTEYRCPNTNPIPTLRALRVSSLFPNYRLQLARGRYSLFLSAKRVEDWGHMNAATAKGPWGQSQAESITFSQTLVAFKSTALDSECLGSTSVPRLPSCAAWPWFLQEQIRLVVVIVSEDSMTKYLAQCLTNINANYMLFRGIVRFVHLCLKQLMKTIKGERSAKNQTGPETCRNRPLLKTIPSLQ